MKVTLRIVGLFFNKKVEKSGSFKNVQDVMDTYINAKHVDTKVKGGLSYEDEKDGTLKSITFHYDGKYDFDVNTPETGTKTLGNKHLAARERTLTEVRVDDNTILAWQYYVISKGGKNKSATNGPGGFTAYNKPANYKISENDTIIWRLVAINLTKEEQASSKKYA